MNNIAQLTIKVIQSFSSSKFCVPAGVAVTAIVIRPVFKPIYRGWRILRLFNLYKKPDNHAQLAAGHVVNMAAGDALLVRTSAICLHILAQIMNCVNEMQKIEDEFETIKKARSCHYIKQETAVWQTESKVQFISISRQIKIIHTGKNIALRVQIIAISILKVGKHMFLLTMKTTYLINIFFLTNDIKNDSVNEIFVNSSSAIDELSNKKEYVIKKLKRNEDSINEIFNLANSKLQVADIIEAAKNKLKADDNSNQSSNNISNSARGLFKAYYHKWRWEILFDLGLERYSPKPGPEVLKWYANNYKPAEGDRYPPPETITKTILTNTQIVRSDNPTLATAAFAKKIKLKNLLGFDRQATLSN